MIKDDVKVKTIFDMMDSKGKIMIVIEPFKKCAPFLIITNISHIYIYILL